MARDARIFVAGHRGMVGSALVRRLQASGRIDTAGGSTGHRLA
jgi:nucleoside-diphosphate-sugar epimerase